MPTLRIVKHANGYYYAHIRGSRSPFSLKTKDHEEAKRIARESNLANLAEAKRIGIVGPQLHQHILTGKKTSVKQALDEYMDYMPTAGYSQLTVHHVGTHLRSWVENTDIGPSPVTSITDGQINAWVNNRRSDLAYSTRLRHLADIRAFLGWAHGASLIGFNPSLNVVVRADILPQDKRIPKERIPFSDEEIARILASLKPGDFWHAATLLSYETGLRLRDCALLERSAVSGSRSTVAVVKSRNNTIVTHNLSDACVDSLRRAPSDERWFFPWIAKQLLGDLRYNSTLSQQFRRICIKLGIEGKSFHGIRHTHAMNKYRDERHRIYQEAMNELALKKTQASLGHSSEATTKIYLRHPAR